MEIKKKIFVFIVYHSGFLIKITNHFLENNFFKMPFSRLQMETIDENITIHYFHITEITSELESVIDNYIISICNWPDYQTNLLTQKRSLRLLLEWKQWSTLEIGFISEFFIHLYLNYKWFHQECLYENLEEKGIKKWFDGYYSCDDAEWLVESKSGAITTQNISHKSKINEAYIDLSSKVSGRNIDSNNQPISPWKNAFHHARIANSRQSIVKNINDLSEDFKNWIFHNIDEFNIIPVSTIFLDWKTALINSIEDYETIKNEIMTWLSWKNIKKWHVICTTQATKDTLLNYLAQACSE